MNCSPAGKKKKKSRSKEAKGITLVDQHRGNEIQQPERLPSFPTLPVLSSCFATHSVHTWLDELIQGSSEV